MYTSTLRNKMFMNWKIPSRLVDGEEEPQKECKTPEKPATAPPQLPDIHQKPLSPAEKPQSPAKPRSPVKPSSPDKPPSPRKSMSRESAIKPVSHLNKKESSLLDAKKKDAIKRVIHPAMWQTAENMLTNASSCERRVIEKALLAAARRGNYDNALGKSLLPDAKQTVRKWLEDASEEDRDVALRFFTSLGGTQLLGVDTEVKKQRLQEVLESLENGKANGTPRQKAVLDKSKSGNRVFKHVQLVNPADKANREQHTTWHHIPQYKNVNTVQNTSSHYTHPQKIIQRHFTIHPDWGI